MTDTNDSRGRSRRAALVAGGIASVAGTVVFVGSALTMVCMWVSLLLGSMGWLGVLLGIVTSPVAVAYPFLHWAARGEFPVLYFVIWLAGIFGMAMSMAWAVFGRRKIAKMRARSIESNPHRAAVTELQAPTQAVD